MGEGCPGGGCGTEGPGMVAAGWAAAGAGEGLPLGAGAGSFCCALETLISGAWPETRTVLIHNMKYGKQEENQDGFLNTRYEGKINIQNHQERHTEITLCFLKQAY